MVNKRCFAASAAVVTSCFALIAAPANAAEELSVAIGFGSNGVIGVAENVTTSQEDASNQAKADCTNRGGIRCISIANATNGCVAVAVVGSSVYGGIGATREKAEQSALDHGGVLKESRCSIAGPYTGGGAGSTLLAQPAPPSQSNSREVTGDVDVYDVPGGVGSVIGMLEGGEGQTVQLGSGCKDDNWCNIVWPGGPGGKAWVWGDFLK
jgi:hypothetical protein